ncbi:nucleoside-diphosphate sugar epimerase/dehydratase [Alkalibacillus salilacus]|uniref:FlaA1/EpsC-like NDP-sugar epimerase n=1 Tax=Alkalibacillus salilacus TaxID=284582 RepID=A0ABT9VI37_9BACI|nr:nucleoside-diphosphate sugar epimerase/dehydratase [Alkalibacillus salilacus]MDQ0160547.1 FlaA1/EpsC-like NDP-sugar epimerase [Alkalibacillus salilacus]
MTYRNRIAILMLLDSLIVLSAIFLSSYILYDTFAMREDVLLISAIVLFVAHHVFAVFYGLYQKAWEYASIGELFIIFNTVTLSILFAALTQYVLQGSIMLRALLVTWMLHMLMIGGSRFAWRMFRDNWFQTIKGKRRTLIVGAGSAGTMVARQLLSSHETELHPVVFLDDDPKKEKIQFLGIPVKGTVKDVVDIVKQEKIEHIIIAAPSMPQSNLNTVFEQCSETKVHTQIMPKMEDILTGKVSINQFRDVEVEDLLGREPVELDTVSVSSYITNKTALITGAGGSIGSEICRQIAEFSPEKLILLGHGENSIYKIERELQNQKKGNIEIIPLIADIKDRARMFEIMSFYQPDVIYHAAAHKHVPLMESNPFEAVKNNVFGTKNVADAANEAKIGTFVLVSSDKAVKPTNVMGSTKRIAEMVVQQLNEKSNTNFVAVRFGNVLGSRGSVIPLFKEQISQGGPVTVTDPEMTRYFMTIPEASRLVIQAGALARGGEIFVLDMGQPVKIVDLAKNLIKLSGFTEEEIGIVFSGIRPGEKMYEELLNKTEKTERQVFPKIYIGRSVMDDQPSINLITKDLETINQNDVSNYVIKLANGQYDEVKKFSYLKTLS